MNPNIENLRAWANSEHDDSYFVDLAKLRLDIAKNLDSTNPHLAVRLPFREMMDAAKGGLLTHDVFAEQAPFISREIADYADYFFGKFTEMKSKQQIRQTPLLRGYLAEVSFYLLMLHRPYGSGVITLPSTIEGDVFSGRDHTGHNRNFDATSYHTNKAFWQKIQIKSSAFYKNKKFTYEDPYNPEIKIVAPPNLPIKRWVGRYELPLNVIYDYIDSQAGDDEAARRMDANSQRLVDYVRS